MPGLERVPTGSGEPQATAAACVSTRGHVGRRVSGERTKGRPHGRMTMVTANPQRACSSRLRWEPLGRFLGRSYASGRRLIRLLSRENAVFNHRLFCLHDSWVERPDQQVLRKLLGWTTRRLLLLARTRVDLVHETQCLHRAVPAAQRPYSSVIAHVTSA